MCGIAGLFATSPRNKEALHVVTDRMIHSLKHRGPDDQGIWNDPSGFVSLGHCRLAIIDLSIEGHQPMASNCGRFTIAFNGEIYNYLELKKMLLIEGASFRGHSDTEVFLEAICRWGLEKSLTKIVGMFAFALWDGYERRLTLGRDRTGKKPLYFFLTSHTLFFGSEIKAFKVIEDIHLSVNPNSIYQYLTFGYVPAPNTIYEGLTEVPAGHYVIFNEDLTSRVRCYWKLRSNIKNHRISFEEAVYEAESLLKEAVNIRLRADVPVGCFLSGGVDSGLLTAFASLQMSSKLKTFTVSFDNGMFDESPAARIVARKYETDHHVLRVRPDVKKLLPKLVRAYGQPFADASAIPSFCISEEARKFVAVVINGEGGDELFCGYRRHLAMKLLQQLTPVLKIMPDMFVSLAHKLFPQPSGFRTKYAFFHRYLRGLGKDPYERYIAWCVDGFDEQEKENLYTTLPSARLLSTELLFGKLSGYELRHPFEQFMAWDFFVNMHDDMLVKMDIATMAYGLEGRNPFLDHRLVEWAYSLPQSILLNNFDTKPILRSVAKRYLPDEVSMAPKRGFEIPLIRWLRGDLSEAVNDICLSPNGIVMNLFNKEYIEDLLHEKQDIDPDRWSKRVWILFMLGMWEVTEN